MTNYYYLDQLILGYFNQDYLYINEGEDTIEGIVKLFKQTAPEQVLKDLANEITAFRKMHADSLEREFNHRYGNDFQPDLWETTAQEFLGTIQKIVTE
ncbi:hypothetical protein PMPD1_1347 [Paramixta manurensis]|uniref:CdiI immunity protein domain-containing protein n=1 Tax=Paramixta manurensis TaxID=2740817 RepID=A0A6M8U6L1_9GAMM|nr:hypothetical protein PMPD1_1347 [Erwiniaceae bacterium PD-1]